MKSGKVFLGLLAGVAVGAVLGILFAPDKGTETRRKITKKRDDLTGSIKDKFSSFVDGISSTFSSVTDEATSLISAGKEKADHLRGRADEARKEAKSF